MTRTRGIGACLLLLAVVAIGVASYASPARAQSDTDTDTTEPVVDRTLIISIPTVTWDELTNPRYRNLRRLASQSALAGLTTRPVRPGDDARAGDAYLSLGAGARTETPADAAGQAFGADETVDGRTGRAVYERDVLEPLTSDIGQVAWLDIEAHNGSLRYDAELGAVATALAEVDVSTAVIGNADQPGSDEVVDDVVIGPYHREIALALMDASGQVDGRVDTGLLAVDRDAPFDVRLDNDAVLAAFDDEWRDQRVVAVEASDLARVEAIEADASEGTVARARRAALERTDELVGQLLERTDEDRDAVLVIAPYHSSPGVDLTVAMLRAPGYEPGLLTSATTQRNGYVTITDVGPTLATLMGAAVPGAMEGTEWERGSEGGSTVDARIDRLVDANRSAKMRDDTITSATVVLITAAVLVLLAGLVVLARPAARGRRSLAMFALAVPGFLIGTHLVLVFPVADWWWGFYWVIVITFALAFAAVIELVSRGDALVRTLLAFGALTAFHLINQILGGPLELNSVFGYTATVGIRISGLGNQSFAELSIAALVVAAVALVKPGGRVGQGIAIGTLVATVIVIGAPFWGADFGGLLAATPAFLVFGHLASGRTLRVRTVIGVLVAAVVAGLAVGFIDLARPSGQRTHIGRFFERVGRDGWEGFWTVITRKLGLVFEVFANPFIILLTVGLIVLVVLAGRWWWRTVAASVEAELPTLRAMLVACAVVGGLGLALNDSGIVVPGTMLAVLVPALLALTPAAPAEPTEELQDPGPHPTNLVFTRGNVPTTLEER